MELDDRELATVLAALRYWARMQAHCVGTSNTTLPEDDVATCGGTLDPLRAEDIDALCERINLTAPGDYTIETGERRLSDEIDVGSLCTPNGNRIVSTAETLIGSCEIRQVRRLPTGELEIDHCGGTDVYWDAQETVKQQGQRVYIDDDGGYWLESQLHIVDAASDADDQGGKP